MPPSTMTAARSSGSSSTAAFEPIETHTFTQRACSPDTPSLATYLYKLMHHKQSNLCLSADAQSSSELLSLAEECGDSIVVLKTHCDIVHDFSKRTVRGLTAIAQRKKFLIFEDRKFGDIGSTVQMQYAAGPHKIATWANITNANIFPGPAIIDSLRTAARGAVSSTFSSFSTEIKGGAESYFDSQGEFEKFVTFQQRNSEDYSPRHKPSSEVDDEDGDEEEEDNEPPEEAEDGYPSPDARDADAITRRHSARSMSRHDSSNASPLDRRKSSVVSISTTISSSTEYISPPQTSTATSPGASSLAAYAAHFDPTRPPITCRGLLLLAQMSSSNNFFSPQYTAKCIELARENRDFVIGFVAQESLNREPGDNFLVFTPGVSLPPADAKAGAASSTGSKGASAAATAAGGGGGVKGADGMGQQYNTPRHVVLEKGCDIIIVGRGIMNAPNPAAEAERYRVAGWEAYCERTGNRATGAGANAGARGVPIR